MSSRGFVVLMPCDNNTCDGMLVLYIIDLVFVWISILYSTAVV